MSRTRLQHPDVGSASDAKRIKAALLYDVEDEEEMSQIATQDEKGSTISTEVGVSKRSFV